MNNKCQRCGNAIVTGQNFCNCCGLQINNMNISNQNYNHVNNGYSSMNQVPGMGKFILSREENFYGFAVI